MNPDIRVYWHRELPPSDMDPLAEHVVEATSDHVHGQLTRDADEWEACYASLMAAARQRIAQEVTRLDGDCAHVLGEIVDARHNEAAGDAWLHGQFNYVLFRRRRPS